MIVTLKVVSLPGRAVPVAGAAVRRKSTGPRTTKDSAEVAVPPAVVTESGPVVAPVGTVAVMEVGLVTIKPGALVPLKATAATVMKFVPVIVAEAATRQ